MIDQYDNADKTSSGWMDICGIEATSGIGAIVFINQIMQLY